MTRSVFLLALVGCNQAFGLDDTRLVDAGHPFFDAPADAPPACGAPSEAPSFDQEFHQAVFANQQCSQYQTSVAGVALAVCRSPSKFALFEGPVGPLNGMTLAKGDVAAPSGGAIYGIGLAPEGSEAYIAQYDIPTNTSAVKHYRRDATGTWLFQDTLPVTFMSGQKMTGVSRGPHRHLMVVESNYVVREWKSDDNGLWTEAGTYAATDFGTTIIYSLDLTADGLRVMLYAQDPQGQFTGYYAYRNTIDERFGSSVEIPSAPKATDIFLSPDCDRMYFSGVGAVFYVRRLP